jgi:hypothetical protein
MALTFRWIIEYLLRKGKWLLDHSMINDVLRFMNEGSASLSLTPEGQREPINAAQRGIAAAPQMHSEDRESLCHWAPTL